MIEICKGTNLSVFLQRIKQKEEMENKKPIVLNNLEEWDFTDYIDSLIQKEEAVDLEFKVAKDGLPNSLWDTYSSFANTDGGVIVLGVKEHKQQFIIEGLTKEQISQYKKDFWNQINNPDCVNENPLIISIRSIVSIEWCIYLTFMPRPCKYAVKSSAIFTVRVVTSTRSFFSVLAFISITRSSI